MKYLNEIIKLFSAIMIIIVSNASSSKMIALHSIGLHMLIVIVLWVKCEKIITNFYLPTKNSQSSNMLKTCLETNILLKEYKKWAQLSSGNKVADLLILAVKTSSTSV